MLRLRLISNVQEIMSRLNLSASNSKLLLISMLHDEQRDDAAPTSH
jgi:hypothetical protein